MKPFTSPILCLALLLGCLVPVFGQEIPKVRLKFVSFPKVADSKPVELLIGEGKTLEVKLPTNSISEAYEVPGLSTWVLGKSSEDEEGKFRFETFGQAKAVGAKDQLIVVVRKGASDSDGLELTPLELSESGFGGGKYFLLNASRVDIGGSIGTAKFAMKPGGFQMIAPEPTKKVDGRSYSYAQIFFRLNEEVQPFFTATWRFNEKARSMVFFYHEPQSKKLKVHTIRSFVP